MQLRMSHQQETMTLLTDTVRLSKVN